MNGPNQAELRARLRALAAKMPPGAAEWPQHKAAQFKADLRAAHRAADHPLAGAWVLRQALQTLATYHEPPSP